MTNTPTKQTHQKLWRSIEDLENDPKVQELFYKEFPNGASTWNDPITRRRFLKVMGASIALAGLNGCTWFTSEDAVPYVNAPEEIIPGMPLFYATSSIFSGFAKGILAETYMARPTKLEGSPEHPATLGGSDVFMQAILLNLYDPERGKIPKHRGAPASWDEFYTHLTLDRFPVWDKTAGKGLRLLTGTITSPTLFSQIQELLSRYPQARWHQYETISRDSVIEGSRLAFGKPLQPIYKLNNAQIILSLGSDFLAWGPGDVRYARDFADQRRLRVDRPKEMNRLYTVESHYSITGASADHRLAMRPSQMEHFTRTLAFKLGLPVEAPKKPLPPDKERWISIVARDLISRPGLGVVIVGDDQPPVVHAIAHWINQRIHAAGKSVVYIPAVEADPVNQLHSIHELAQEIEHEQVDSLFMIGSNPVFTAPANLNFHDLIQKVPHRYCFDDAENETSFYSDWYLPKAHDLESWGDARAFDGTASLQQPVIAPLYQGRAPIELLSSLLKRPGVPGLDILKHSWSKYSNSDRFWERSLHDGFVRDSEFKAVQTRITPELGTYLKNASVPSTQDENSLELQFLPDPRIWDGRFASNAWLQELPKPLTQLTWDNAAIMSPQTAKKLRIEGEQVVRLELSGRSVEASAFILPGQADGVVTVYLGYGKSGQGFNAYLLRTEEHFWSAQGLKITRSEKTYPLACSQHHQTMAGRDLVVLSSLTHEIKKTENKKPLPSLYHEFARTHEAWAMVIDLTVCIGCKACTIACQAENNIPVVGKEEVRNQREMHWIRVDRYFHGEVENPRVAFQPVPCMHCEKAPCEYVCPTEATVHDSSGINQMVYNRCIGTRMCSNNCPYKVRRFNFFQYSELSDPVRKLAYNPNVTVRQYGVMEKCTYCIQRISRARIEARREDREIRAGEVKTACQTACPTRAIVFGNQNNPKEEVTALKAHPLNYGLLEEVGTQPRTSYLARIKNPHPELEPS